MRRLRFCRANRRRSRRISLIEGMFTSSLLVRSIQHLLLFCGFLFFFHWNVRCFNRCEIIIGCGLGSRKYIVQLKGSLCNKACLWNLNRTIAFFFCKDSSLDFNAYIISINSGRLILLNSFSAITKPFPGF